jgi:hypothetical protein
MNAQSTAAAPAVQPGEGCVYVVAFDSGLLKVGQTARPVQRIASHASAAATHGVTLTSTWLSGPHANTTENERALITYCRERAATQHRFEYFGGLDFDEIVAVAEKLEYRRLDGTDPNVKRRLSRLQEDARWGERIRSGSAVVMLPHEFNDFMAALDRADEAVAFVTWLYRRSPNAPARLPDLLRRAADRLEHAPDKADEFHAQLREIAASQRGWRRPGVP